MGVIFTPYKTMKIKNKKKIKILTTISILTFNMLFSVINYFNINKAIQTNATQQTDNITFTRNTNDTRISYNYNTHTAYNWKNTQEYNTDEVSFTIFEVGTIRNYNQLLVKPANPTETQQYYTLYTNFTLIIKSVQMLGVQQAEHDITLNFITSFIMNGSYDLGYNNPKFTSNPTFTNNSIYIEKFETQNEILDNLMSSDNWKTYNDTTPTNYTTSNKQYLQQTTTLTTTTQNNSFIYAYETTIDLEKQYITNSFGYIVITINFISNNFTNQLDPERPNNTLITDFSDIGESIYYAKIETISNTKEIGFQTITSTITFLGNTINYEVIDIGGLMLTILTLPFNFISQAFNLTLFQNTPYAVNIGNLIKGIIAIGFVLVIIKLIANIKAKF